MLPAPISSALFSAWASVIPSSLAILAIQNGYHSLVSSYFKTVVIQGYTLPASVL